LLLSLSPGTREKVLVLVQRETEAFSLAPVWGKIVTFSPVRYEEREVPPTGMTRSRSFPKCSHYHIPRIPNLLMVSWLLLETLLWSSVQFHPWDNEDLDLVWQESILVVICKKIVLIAETCLQMNPIKIDIHCQTIGSSTGNFLVFEFLQKA
jgi:hypothetical protein